MIRGVGVDIISVARIAKAMEEPHFTQRILTPAERETPPSAEYLAGRWAAKEAIKKALPAINSWQDVEVISKDGPPVCRILNEALPQNLKIWVSISHEKDHAVAMAVVEEV